MLDTRRSVIVLAALAVSSVSSGPSQAQEVRVLEEITVTAAYREQGLQDVPVSISAVTGETLAETAIQKAEDIQFLVPNFTLTETGIVHHSSTFNAWRSSEARSPFCSARTR
jgi:outer membrane receptor for ferrienterochelin and colicin